MDKHLLMIIFLNVLTYLVIGYVIFDYDLISSFGGNLNLSSKWIILLAGFVFSFGVGLAAMERLNNIQKDKEVQNG